MINVQPYRGRWECVERKQTSERSNIYRINNYKKNDLSEVAPKIINHYRLFFGDWVKICLPRKIVGIQAYIVIAAQTPVVIAYINRYDTGR